MEETNDEMILLADENDTVPEETDTSTKPEKIRFPLQFSTMRDDTLDFTLVPEQGLLARRGCLKYALNLEQDPLMIKSKKLVKIGVSCRIPFMMQAFCRDFGKTLKSSTVSSRMEGSFKVDSTVKVGSEVQTLFIDVKVIGFENDAHSLLSANISIEVNVSKLTGPKPITPKSTKRKSVTFSNYEEIITVAAEHPTPRHPKSIIRSDSGAMVERKPTPFILTTEQKHEVEEKIRQITSNQNLTYGDLLLLSIGKFMRDLPPHVEEFCGWLGARKWIDPDTHKFIKMYPLMSDRKWLHPIIQEMYHVHAL